MASNSKTKVIGKINGGGPPFKIERDVPLVSSHKENPYNGVFSAMKVNDSFLIDDEDSIKGVKYQAAKWALINKVKFAIRKTDQGTRCWRVS